MAKRFLVSLVASLATLSAVAAPAQAVGSSRLPVPYQGSANQVVTVVAASPAATTATLTAWQRIRGIWFRAYGPFPAFVGKDGVGQASETTSHTPQGVWTLTEAFGIQAGNGTRLPYRRVDTSDWWVSDTTSPYYNTHYRCTPGTCPFNVGAGEDLGRAGTAYNHATVIDYNRHPAVPGAGSAFFLHVSAGKPTAGCVSLPSDNLDTVMRWLDPAQHPVIDIGVAS